MDAEQLAAIRNLVDRSVPLNLYTERALLDEIDRLQATIRRVRMLPARVDEAKQEAWIDANELIYALEGGEAS